LKKYDVRVIVVGKKVFTTLIHSQDNEETKTDWRNGENILEHTKAVLPKSIERKCIKLLKILKLQFGAIDFIMGKENNFIFLEINPNGQWARIEKQTGYKISDEIVNLLIKKKNIKKYYAKIFLKQIREFFWPLLEKRDNTQCLNSSK
jgi:glutathione synthase/RimK-type ligase-like ATP-grasp enzyme